MSFEEVCRSVQEEGYNFPGGATMNRENGKSPNGNSFGGCWVLRGADGSYMDHDQYRHDLAERHRLKLSK